MIHSKWITISQEFVFSRQQLVMRQVISHEIHLEMLSFVCICPQSFVVDFGYRSSPGTAERGVSVSQPVGS